MWQLIGLFQSIGWWKAHRRDGNFSLNGSVIKISKIRHIIWQEIMSKTCNQIGKIRWMMSKTCHQIATIAHIWAQLVIKISKIRHIWFKLAIKLAQNDLYEHFFLIWRPVPLYEITIKSYSYFLSCLRTSVFLTSTEKEKCPWVSSSENSWGKFFLHQYLTPILVVKCYFRLLGVL